MEDKNKPGLAASALAAVKRFAGGERPETLKGLKGVWLIASCAGVVCVLLTLVMGLCGEAGWAGIFAGCAVALLLFSNLWFRERVTSPILGLGDTARRIADGSYGSLAEKLRDDEIGRFVDAFNDLLSVARAEDAAHGDNRLERDADVRRGDPGRLEKGR